MFRITHYVVLSFARDQGGTLRCLEEEKASGRKQGASLAASLIGRRRQGNTIVGAALIARTSDPDVTRLKAVVILARYGDTPDSFAGVT